MSATSGASAADMETEANVVRAELAQTLDALRENLRPRNLTMEILRATGAGASALSDQLWKAANRNPIPALLIGCGLGSAAVASRSFGSAAASSSRSSRRSKRGASDQATAQSSQLSASADFQGGAGMARTYSSTWGLSRSLRRIVEEQPLILAAIGLPLGFALGAAFPRSESETKVLGDASHAFKEAARNAAQQRYSEIKSAAESTIKNIEQSASDHGLNRENLADLASDTGEKLRDAAASVKGSHRTAMP